VLLTESDLGLGQDDLLDLGLRLGLRSGLWCGSLFDGCFFFLRRGLNFRFGLRCSLFCRRLFGGCFYFRLGLRYRLNGSFFGRCFFRCGLSFRGCFYFGFGLGLGRCFNLGLRLGLGLGRCFNLGLRLGGCFNLRFGRGLGYRPISGSGSGVASTTGSGAGSGTGSDAGASEAPAIAATRSAFFMEERPVMPNSLAISFSSATFLLSSSLTSMLESFLLDRVAENPGGISCSTESEKRGFRFPHGSINNEFGH
jgi:hypothetical protein